MGDAFSSESSCFGMGEVSRPGCHEYHDDRDHLGVPFASSSVYRPSSEHRYEPKECGSDFPILTRLARKGCGQKNSERKQSSSLLFETFLRTERAGENPTHHRPVVPQQIVGGTQVQDGDSGQDCEEYSGGLVGHVGGHHRCLPSCPYRMGLSCLLCLCLRRRDLRLSGPTVRAILGSLDLFQGHEAHQEVPSFLRSTGLLFLGRLLDFGGVSPFDGCSHQSDFRPSAEVGIQDQLGEIFNCSSTTPRIPWGHSRPAEPHSVSSPREDRQDRVLREARSPSLSDVQEGPGEARGVLELHCSLSASRSSLLDSCDGVDESPLFSGVERPSGPLGQGSERGFGSMGRHGGTFHSGAHASASPFRGDHDGRVVSRLEWLAFTRRSVWFMGPGRSGPLYELVGVEGGSSDSPSLLGTASGSFGQGSFGQLDSGGLPPPSGLCWFAFTVGAVERYLGFGRGLGRHASSLPPEGCSKRPGGPRFQVGSHFYRMVFRSSFVLGYLRVGRVRARGGSLCHSFQLAIAYFCFSVPRPSCSRSGRVEFGLEQVGEHLSLPSYSDPAGGVAEVETVFGEGVPSGSQESAGSCTIFPVEEVLSVLSSPSWILPVPTNRPGNLLRERPAALHLEPCRLDAIINGYTKKGYGANSIRVLLELHRESTLRQYQAAWTLFLGFLGEWATAHHELGLPGVFEFFARFHELGRAYYTLAVYRCALKLPLRLELALCLDCDDSDDFMRGLYNARPPPKPGAGAPAWALSDLLHYLMSDTFEPLADKSLRTITKKALALTLLATGRRIDDVAAFTRFYRTEGSSLRMTVPASHLSKNEKKGHVPEDATVLSLISPHQDDLSLCPVRALGIYFLKRNVVVNKANDWRLWMHSKTILSYMISSLIIEARVVADRSDDVSCGPHHLRKFAASYSKANWESTYQQVLFKRMGSKSMSVLARDYINLVDPLTVSCVVPMGSIVVPPP